MSYPPVFPLRPLSRAKWYRQTPPAIFPPLLGVLALGLAWRNAGAAFGIPAGVVEMVLGAATLCWVWAAFAYGVKVSLRPAVLLDELKTLPGRAGLAALMMSIYAAAAVLIPYAPGLGAGLLLVGLGLHFGLVALVVTVLWQAGPEARVVTPVWHLSFAGFILAALPAAALGWDGMVRVIFWATLPVAGLVWTVSLWQILRRIPPLPLRPLLAIHLAPVALIGMVAASLGLESLALGLAVAGAVLLAVLVVSLRWITGAGFSAFWGAFTFPLSAYAGFLLSLDGGWRVAGALLLVLATLIVPPIAVKIAQAWAKGELAARTNAAVA